ncbi:MAG TPA: hypothetical protein VFV74_12625 [Burkholderiales bacterium]|nr:hypothetical protein [Burkholderiales bacterium]
MRPLCFLVLILCLPLSRADESIRALDRQPIVLGRDARAVPTHELGLELAYFEEAWSPAPTTSALREGATILTQCGVAITSAELIRLEAPARYRSFHTAEARELASALRLTKPTIYFMAGTRQSPSFDAEAIGRANSDARPEIADTVWVARGARDLGIVIAHELAHVLMDSGEHSGKTGNLMREDTAPGNTQLDAAQCERLRATATANGLLWPLPDCRDGGLRGGTAVDPACLPPCGPEPP